MKQQLNLEMNTIIERNRIFNDLERIAESKNYIKVLPDYFEEYDSFFDLNKRIDPKKTVKIISPTNDILLLRPDVTTNLIKQLIPFWEKNTNLQLYYNTTVFEQTEKGIQQFRQFGLEYIGSNDIGVEKKVLEDVLLFFDRFKDGFQLVLGNQYFIDYLIDSIQYLDKAYVKNVIMAKDQDSLFTLIKGNTQEEELLRRLFKLNGSVETVIQMLEEFTSLEFVNKIVQYFNVLKEAFEDKMTDYIELDLALLSQYDYYSGIVVQGYLKNIPYPILYGGRYNNLTKEMGMEIPAFGISFDVSSFVKEAKNV